MVKVRLHVKAEGAPELKTHEQYELTRVPVIGELLSISGGPLYTVFNVFHTPDRHNEEDGGYHAEVWVRIQTKEEYEAYQRRR